MLAFVVLYFVFYPKDVGKVFAKIMVEYEKEMKKLKGE